MIDQQTQIKQKKPFILRRAFLAVIMTVFILPQIAFASDTAVSAYRSTSSQSVSSGSPTKIQLNGEQFDLGGNFDSTTNYRFVAPAAGYYHFDYAGKLNTPVDRKEYVFFLKLNGTTDIAAENNEASNAGAGDVSSAGSRLVFLNTNDYVELWFYHDSGSSKNVAAGIEATYLSVYRVFLFSNDSTGSSSFLTEELFWDLQNTAFTQTILISAFFTLLSSAFFYYSITRNR